jgi:hypothetical protein
VAVSLTKDGRLDWVAMGEIHGAENRVKVSYPHRICPFNISSVCTTKSLEILEFATSLRL